MGISSKISRLDAYLENNDLESVWLATPPMFSWLTGGDSRIDWNEAAGCAIAGYDGDDVLVVTSNIEGPRLLEEELGNEVTLVEVPWYEQNLRDAVQEVADQPAAIDLGWGDFEKLEPRVLTQPLTADDIERYRTLGVQTAEAVEAVGVHASSDDTEQELCARLHQELNQRNIGAPVVLVGSEERAQQYRHFTPKQVEIGTYAILTVVGSRDGLHAAVTRTIAFENAPDWLSDRYRDTARVGATAVGATHRCRTAGEVFDQIRNAYESLGYHNEWQQHHQGGALGYASREWIATPESENTIERPAVYGWNPTIKGTKIEDTTLVTDDKVDVLSLTGDVPTTTANAVGFEFELPIPQIINPNR